MRAYHVYSEESPLTGRYFKRWGDAVHYAAELYSEYFHTDVERIEQKWLKNDYYDLNGIFIDIIIIEQ